VAQDTPVERTGRRRRLFLVLLRLDEALVELFAQLRHALIERGLQGIHALIARRRDIGLQLIGCGPVEDQIQAAE
jgi:hypothetical protein